MTRWRALLFLLALVACAAAGASGGAPGPWLASWLGKEAAWRR